MLKQRLQLSSEKGIRSWLLSKTRKVLYEQVVDATICNPSSLKAIA